MLNSQGIRELAYLTYIDSIEPITGSDNCECANVMGWHVMVKKNEFKVGDIGVYFEIDSCVNTDKEEFVFLKNKHGKIKTQKYTFGGKGNFISQGLLMPVSTFGYKVDPSKTCVFNANGTRDFTDDSRFLTKELGVTYAVMEDNARKASSGDKYKKMAQRYPKLARTKWWRWLMGRKWGKKLLFVLFGRKKDKKSVWPSHICSKTDVERIQNEIYLLNDKQPYVATEKIDGSSCTIACERKAFGRIKYYICSRNVVFENPNDRCFYDTNIYFEAYEKYDFKNKITQILNDYHLNNVALQMEVYGGKIQRRDYSTNEHNAMVFHIVSNGQKYPMDKVVEICEKYDIPHVPVVDDSYIFPDRIEELQRFVEGAPSKIDGKPREGIVFYDKATGQIYTKFVSPEYLLKFH